MIFYWASKFGNKISLVINDGSELSKAKMLEQICKLLNTDGFYGEFSDALEYIIRSKKNISNITDKTQILNILNGLELKNIDDKEFIKNDIFEEEDERRTTFLLNSTDSIEKYLEESFVATLYPNCFIPNEKTTSSGCLPSLFSFISYCVYSGILISYILFRHSMVGWILRIDKPPFPPCIPKLKGHGAPI